MRFLIFLLTLFLVACSEYPEMEMDILAQHIYSQNPIDLDSQNKEYVAMLAKSFGMKEDEIVDIQKPYRNQAPRESPLGILQAVLSSSASDG